MEPEVQIHRRRDKKKNIVLIIFIAFIALMVVSASVFTYLTLQNESVYKGVYVGGLNASGLSKQQLQTQLTAKYDTPDNGTGITLKASDTDIPITFAELDLSFDIDSAVNNAYAVGRTGNVFNRMYDIAIACLNGENISVIQNFDEKKIDTFVNQFSDQVFKSVIEASLLLSDDQVVIRTGKHGEHIDKAETVKLVTDMIKSGQGGIVAPEVIVTNPNELNADDIYDQITSKPSDASYAVENNKLVLTPHSVGRDIDKVKLEEILKDLGQTEEKEHVLPVSIVMPSITSDMATSMIFKDELASAVTSFGTGTVNGQNRKFNMQLAVKTINQLILMPGDEFSFNKVVGPRDVEHGYKTAHVYIRGRIEDGIGGGICQVSTTMYNAVLTADLEVAERKNHSFTVGYVPLGQDATAFYGGTDFRFINSTKWPIKLLSNVSGNKIHFSIMGTNENPGKTVIISNKILSKTPHTVQTTEDPTLPIGTEKQTQEGLDGYVVETYKTIKVDGKVISQKKLHTSKYNPCTQMLIVGTKPVEGATPPVTPPADPEQPVNPEQPGNPEQQVDPEQPGNPEQPDSPEQPGNPDQPDNPEQPGNPEQPVDDNATDSDILDEGEPS